MSDGPVAPLRLFLIAGEPSGDRLGAALMAGLAAVTDRPVEFHGIGGPLMQAQGLHSLFAMEELSHIGLVDILANLPKLLRRVRETADAVTRLQPDALISIDIPEFSLRVAPRVKARLPDLPTIHYVAPTVWAWRPGRARKMARSIDHVLALLPFEPPYMEAEGMGCDFVGHPVVSEPRASAADIAAFRRRHGIGADAPVILALPGSRRSEIARLAPVFGKALGAVVAARPDARIVLPAAPSVASLVEEVVADWPVAPLVLDPRERAPEHFAADKRAAFGAATVALAASGTVSLELAASRTPMVIAYTSNWLSRSVVTAMLRIDTVTLVNLVSETRAVPEFLSDECRPAPIAAALADLLGDGSAQDAQRAAMRLTMERLGEGGPPPGERAARAVLRVLDDRISR